MEICAYEGLLNNNFQKERLKLANRGYLKRRRKPSKYNFLSQHAPQIPSSIHLAAVPRSEQKSDKTVKPQQKESKNPSPVLRKPKSNAVERRNSTKRNAVLIQTWERRSQTENQPIKLQNSERNPKPEISSSAESKSESFSSTQSHCRMSEVVKMRSCSNAVPQPAGRPACRAQMAKNKETAEEKPRYAQVKNDVPHRSVTGTRNLNMSNGFAEKEPEWISLSKKLRAKFIQTHLEPENKSVEDTSEEKTEPKPQVNHVSKPKALQEKKKAAVTVDKKQEEPPWVQLSRKLCNKFIEEHIECQLTNSDMPPKIEKQRLLCQSTPDLRIVENLGKPVREQFRKKQEEQPEWVLLSKKLRAKFIEGHKDDPDTISLDNQLNASDLEEYFSEPRYLQSLSNVTGNTSVTHRQSLPNGNVSPSFSDEQKDSLEDQYQNRETLDNRRKSITFCYWSDISPCEKEISESKRTFKFDNECERPNNEPLKSQNSDDDVNYELNFEEFEVDEDEHDKLEDEKANHDDHVTVNGENVLRNGAELTPLVKQEKREECCNSNSVHFASSTPNSFKIDHELKEQNMSDNSKLVFVSPTNKKNVEQMCRNVENGADTAADLFNQFVEKDKAAESKSLHRISSFNEISNKELHPEVFRINIKSSAGKSLNECKAFDNNQYSSQRSENKETCMNSTNHEKTVIHFYQSEINSNSFINSSQEKEFSNKNEICISQTESMFNDAKKFEPKNKNENPENIFYEDKNMNKVKVKKTKLKSTAVQISGDKIDITGKNIRDANVNATDCKKKTQTKESDVKVVSSNHVSSNDSSRGYSLSSKPILENSKPNHENENLSDRYVIVNKPCRSITPPFEMETFAMPSICSPENKRILCDEDYSTKVKNETSTKQSSSGSETPVSSFYDEIPDKISFSYCPSDSDASSWTLAKNNAYSTNLNPAPETDFSDCSLSVKYEYTPGCSNQSTLESRESSLGSSNFYVQIDDNEQENLSKTKNQFLHKKLSKDETGKNLFKSKSVENLGEGYSTCGSSNFYVHMSGQCDAKKYENEFSSNKVDKNENAKHLKTDFKRELKSADAMPESLRSLFTLPLNPIYTPAVRTSSVFTTPPEPTSHYYSLTSCSSNNNNCKSVPEKAKKAERSSSLKIKDIAHGIILTFRRFQNHNKLSQFPSSQCVDVSHLAKGEVNGHKDWTPGSSQNKISEFEKEFLNKSEYGRVHRTHPVGSFTAGFFGNRSTSEGNLCSPPLPNMCTCNNLNSKPKGYMNQNGKEKPHESKKQKKNEKSSEAHEKKSKKHQNGKHRNGKSELKNVPSVSRKVQQMADGTLCLVTTVSGDSTVPGVYSDSADTESEISTVGRNKLNGESNC